MVQKVNIIRHNENACFPLMKNKQKISLIILKLAYILDIQMRPRKY